MYVFRHCDKECTSHRSNSAIFIVGSWFLSFCLHYNMCVIRQLMWSWPVTGSPPQLIIPRHDDNVDMSLMEACNIADVNYVTCKKTNTVWDCCSIFWQHTMRGGCHFLTAFRFWCFYSCIWCMTLKLKHSKEVPLWSLKGNFYRLTLCKR